MFQYCSMAIAEHKDEGEYFLKPESGIEILLIFVFSVILTILSLLLTFYVLKKYCPSVLKVVAGRK